MQKTSSRFDTALFSVAALWNFAIGSSAFALDLHFELLFNDANRLVDPLARLYPQLTFGFVLFFGFGYAMIALRPDKNRGFVTLATIAKVTAFASISYFYFVGVLPFLAFSAGLGDLIFAFLFAHFLWRNREQGWI